MFLGIDVHILHGEYSDSFKSSQNTQEMWFILYERCSGGMIAEVRHGLERLDILATSPSFHLVERNCGNEGGVCSFVA